MARIDVTIRGAGIFGLSIAWICAQRGARVQVVDPFGPGAGASGGLVGALAPHVPENWNPKKAFQLDSLLMAQGFWEGVQGTGGLSPGYARTGRLQPIADDRALALASARALSAQTLWEDHAAWRVIPAPGDWAPASPTGRVIHDTLTARIHPRQACAALVAALATQGVTVRSEAPDTGPVIWANGLAGLSELSTALGKQVGTGVKGQAALLAVSNPDAPQLFADGLHVIPHADGTVAIGSTSETAYANVATDARLDDVIDRARVAVPALRDAEILERWAGIRPRARSRAPMLGDWPGRPGHYVANGGFKIGFGMAPKTAHVMTDLVLEGRDTIPDGFRVTDSL